MNVDERSQLLHDLKTPLNGVLGFGQLIQHHSQDPQRIELYAKKIIKCGEQMLELIKSSEKQTK